MYASDTDNGVDLGKLVEDIVTVALGKTAGNNDRSKAFVFLEPRDIEDRINRLALCALDKRAGIYNNDVSLGLVGGYLVACPMLIV